MPYASISIGNTTIWWIVNSLILIVYFLSKKYFFYKNNRKAFSWVTVYICLNVLNIIKGCFIAETYWDWKGLANNTFSLLLPLVSYIASNLLAARKMLHSYIHLILPLFIIFIFITQKDGWGLFLMPISFLLLFFSVIPSNWKILIILISIFVMTVDLGARSSVIKFGVPLLFVLLYYCKFFNLKIILEFIRIGCFIIPVALFCMAVFSNIDVFHLSQFVTGNKEIIVKTHANPQENLTADTRTFLYQEVLQSAAKNNYWWFGRSPARGNETRAFADLHYITGRFERLSNEVGILNVFTWTGIIGVILYFMVFYKASYLALNQSNNTFSKMLGLYVAFRWIWAWVEDTQNFSLNYFMIWFMIGLCCSREFRMMNDVQIKYWIQSIFRKTNLTYKLVKN